MGETSDSGQSADQETIAAARRVHAEMLNRRRLVTFANGDQWVVSAETARSLPNVVAIEPFTDGA